ncbi:MAG TPA: undecaprenyl-diphosphate phosphatase, partial [Myxococcales bacterium]|nr:undecaprenyl-diphosphate phosphatase [Myxococcales bacterium]
MVQGLAEFLPISSSAHLTLLPWVLHWEDPGLAFDVALHWGTLAAVLAVFWRDWIRLLRAGLFRQGAAEDVRLFWALVVSAIPGAIIGKLLDHWAEENLRAPLLIACTLGIMGVVLWACDRIGSKTRDLDQMTLGRSLVIGFAQSAALIPGVSRSGSTISVGLAQGFNREAIARFSFLMSTPIIFG